jgi:hypothetical protein
VKNTTRKSYREGSDVEQESAGNVTSSDTVLVKSTNSNYFIRVNTLASLVTENALDRFRNMVHGTNQDDFVNLAGFDSSIVGRLTSIARFDSALQVFTTQVGAQLMDLTSKIPFCTNRYIERVSSEIINRNDRRVGTVKAICQRSGCRLHHTKHVKTNNLTSVCGGFRYIENQLYF